MKQTLLTSCLAAAFILSLGINQSQANPYGTNITIHDSNPDTGNGTGINVGYEDNETEPGMVQSQVWDLEGFFLNGTTLTMIGGFDFLNGVVSGSSTYTSGDIFISKGSERPSANDGTIYDTKIDGNMEYEYV